MDRKNAFSWRSVLDSLVKKQFSIQKFTKSQFSNFKLKIRFVFVSSPSKSAHPGQLKKIKSWGAVLEQPSKQHCQYSPFTSKLGQIGQIGSAV